MKFKYSKYVPNPLDDLDMDELMSKLSDLLLSSGFDNPWDPSGGMDRTIQALHDAILEALFNGGVLPPDVVDKLFGDQAEGSEEEIRERLEQLINEIIQRMQESGYITGAPDLEEERQRRRQPGGGPGEGEAQQVEFEVTDKALDFLGYKALRDLLGSLGHSSAGRHDTRDLSTGVETSGAPKPYEFGDTLNLDATATILNAVSRQAAERQAAAESAHQAAEARGYRPEPGPGPAVVTGGIDIDYQDLMVAQGEYQSSCATVLMLDCSHSMILYGEDRFTPAKRVAMALSHLIRTQYPGDTLQAVLFHDSAEEIPIRELGRVRVGPYYTNTREGLRLARRLLEKQRKDMRQIVMITDGKPSALTQPDGRIYKNAFGLDPFVIAETFAEVSACARAGIMINTFMLARDYDLVAFVRRVAAMCRGKAYFTTPYTLGQYVLMDYMDKKTRTVH
ncbi:MAG TPA: VWA domain-containing protein [Vicinamibacterales bacterium]|nr:VWA domain-containing protein [Vicinamibacterales bacterium]